MSCTELTWLLYSDFVNNLSDDPTAQRELFVLAGDTESVAALDRKQMGQTRQIQTDR